MTETGVPRTRTPYFFRTPFFSSASPRLSAVCPPKESAIASGRSFCITCVAKTSIRRHGRDVWVHEDDSNVLFLECLNSLRARVVEFSCLAYLQATASEQKNFLGFIHIKISKAQEPKHK